MVYLGFNVYLAHQSRQNRFLVDCLGPAIAELRSSMPGLLCWFDRFDARGPHLLVLVSVAAGEAPRISEMISSKIGAYLALRWDGETVSREEIEGRHAACWGKVLCAVDHEPGFAEEGSFRSFEQPADGYPFFLMRGVAAPEEVWRMLSDQSLWAIDELAAVAPRNAIASSLRWLAALERRLARLHPDAADYWRYHVGTLLPDLREELNDPEAGIHQTLHRAVGERNRKNFERIWAESEGEEGPWPGLWNLLEQATAETGPPSVRQWIVLREIVHTTLLQLGLAVALQLPGIVFCWQRSLEARDRDTTPAVQTGWLHNP